MNDIKSDALVFCGASGDLAYKKIFPALQSMIKRGHLTTSRNGPTRRRFRTGFIAQRRIALWVVLPNVNYVNNEDLRLRPERHAREGPDRTEMFDVSRSDR